ncbi:MAG TPA: hypothetical protein VK599_12295 [Streptosporangiaceae bacterium]|nr:hypothetical protein [Streptosporangiaceae bacterium]
MAEAVPRAERAAPLTCELCRHAPAGFLVVAGPRGARARQLACRRCADDALWALGESRVCGRVYRIRLAAVTAAGTET